LGQVAMRGRDQPAIGVPCLGPAYPPKDARFEQAQQLDLQRQRNVGKRDAEAVLTIRDRAAQRFFTGNPPGGLTSSTMVSFSTAWTMA
jgi:hypothetical protein